MGSSEKRIDVEEKRRHFVEYRRDIQIEMPSQEVRCQVEA
jgi:hypothetical protein